VGELGVGDPILQVLTTEVVDLAELTGRDHVPSQAHGGHEAVVEGAHVLDARRLHA
jgi:hypothetical protein